jgi:hypothetical protein
VTWQWDDLCQCHCHIQWISCLHIHQHLLPSAGQQLAHHAGRDVLRRSLQETTQQLLLNEGAQQVLGTAPGEDQQRAMQATEQPRLQALLKPSQQDGPAAILAAQGIGSCPAGRTADSVTAAMDAAAAAAAAAVCGAVDVIR